METAIATALSVDRKLLVRALEQIGRVVLGMKPPMDGERCDRMGRVAHSVTILPIIVILKDQRSYLEWLLNTDQ